MDISSIGNSPIQPADLAGAKGTPAPTTPAQRIEAEKPKASKPNEELKNNKPVSEQSLTDALKKLNDFVGSASRDLEFARDKETDIQVVKVIDRSTKEVIRQIPSEEVLQIAKALDKLQGLLVRDKV